jgi:hypothetical protein
MITLGQDEQKRDVVIPLTPGASISGRIVDEDGKPLTGCSVQGLEFAHGQGDRRLNATQGGNSDDRGQYRLQGLAKGRYYMFVQCGKRLPSPHGFILGVDHFIALNSIGTRLTANWIPWQVFWTSFFGIAFIADGLSIGLQVLKRWGRGVPRSDVRALGRRFTCLRR